MHNVILLWYIHELPKKCKAEQIKWKRRNWTDWNEIRQDKKFNILIKNNFFRSLAESCLYLCFEIDFLLPMFLFWIKFCFLYVKEWKEISKLVGLFLYSLRYSKKKLQEKYALHIHIYTIYNCIELHNMSRRLLYILLNNIVICMLILCVHISMIINLRNVHCMYEDNIIIMQFFSVYILPMKISPVQLGFYFFLLFPH